MTWVNEFAELELEIGPEHFCRTINTVNGVTNWMYGEGGEIPSDLLEDLWAISAIMTDNTK